MLASFPLMVLIDIIIYPIIYEEKINLNRSIKEVWKAWKELAL
jgi:hypothetical protein